MESIKERYSELKLLDDRMEHLNLLLEETKNKKKEIINNCSHDLVLAFQENKYGDLFLWKCECLLCKERLDLTLNQRIYSFGDKKVLNQRIDLDNIINIIACVSQNTREQYVMGGEYNSLVGERARKKLVELINGNKKLTKEEIKFLIITDLMLFDHGLQKNDFKEYTTEEIRMAIQPDKDLVKYIQDYTDDEIRMAMQPDNVEMVNAWGTERVDLSSDDVKRKIK